ncbi:MAG: copper homeostasis membrane protein CopD [Rhizomicrobium sp.]
MIVVLAIIRMIHFASLMVIFGGSAYLVLLRHRLQIVPRAANGLHVAFVFSATLALLTAILWLCLASGQMSGDWGAAFDASTVERAVRGTRFGTVFAIRIAGLALLLFMSARRRLHRTEVQVVLGALLLASLGLTSHAAASADFPAGYMRAANDAAHLLTAGFWTGGLVTLALLTREHLNAPAKVIAPLRLFSLWGTYAVAVLVLTGVLNAMAILELWPPRLNLYRGVLVVKIALAAAMIALAIVNRWRIAPALTRDDAAPHRLALTVAVEIALGAMVIVAAGFLGLLPPGSDAF